MYAILRQGSHQYRVSPGDVIQIEKIDAEEGSEIDLEDVLLLSDGDSVEVGSPRVDDASVKAKVLRNGRGKKITIYKFKRRKAESVKMGHRQAFTEVEIVSISKGGQQIGVG